METKETKSGSQIVAPSEVFNNNGRLDQIIKTQGYDHGKLFSSHEKATYTFLFESDVISLHCDVMKEILYLKGHKINTWQDHIHLDQFLGRFRKALVSEKTPLDFLSKFDTLVARIL